ncbi:hypothetical protein [Actinomyces procaprae]|uniref:hypothetical protein n=1 Tax=Actinomyces procaprae TaxID=2560010 RepID=UPI001447D455|nr:hypothetical protein [Actinomyces procaprae]
MIWSVSTALRRRGAPIPVWRMNFSMACFLLEALGGAAQAAVAGRSAGVDSVPRTAVAAATTGETR